MHQGTFAFVIEMAESEAKSASEGFGVYSDEDACPTREEDEHTDGAEAQHDDGEVLFCSVQR